MFHITQSEYKNKSLVLIVNFQLRMPWELKTGLVQTVLKEALVKYRHKLAKVFILNASNELKIAFPQIIKEFGDLHEIITLSKKNTCKKLEISVDENMRLRCYGGKNNEPNTWWPPVILPLQSQPPFNYSKMLDTDYEVEQNDTLRRQQVKKLIVTSARESLITDPGET